LTEWATGLRQASGVAGFGWNEWVLAPDTGIAMGLNKSSSRVVTGSGDTFSVSWALHQTGLRVHADVPDGTKGTIRFRGSSKAFSGGHNQSATLPL
jgi:hypothetical protein